MKQKIKFIINILACLKCIINGKNLLNNSNKKNITNSKIYIENQKEECNITNSNMNVNKYESTRSFPILGYNTNIEKINFSDRNNLEDYSNIEKVKGIFSLPFEKMEEMKFHSEPIITEYNFKENMRIETNSGANCCTGFDKKCQIF